MFRRKGREVDGTRRATSAGATIDPHDYTKSHCTTRQFNPSGLCARPCEPRWDWLNRFRKVISLNPEHPRRPGRLKFTPKTHHPSCNNIGPAQAGTRGASSALERDRFCASVNHARRHVLSPSTWPVDDPPRRDHTRAKPTMCRSAIRPTRIGIDCPAYLHASSREDRRSGNP